MWQFLWSLVDQIDDLGNSLSLASKSFTHHSTANQRTIIAMHCLDYRGSCRLAEPANNKVLFSKSVFVQDTEILIITVVHRFIKIHWSLSCFSKHLGIFSPWAFLCSSYATWWLAAIAWDPSNKKVVASSQLAPSEYIVWYLGSTFALG